MRPLKNLCEIAVIGGGLAGLAAARHAARLGRLVTLFEGSGMYGGQVATVGHVEGLPFPGQFSGQDLAIHMLEQARKSAVRVVERVVASVEASERIVITDDTGEAHHPEVVIVASGASLRKLGMSGEEEFYGRGVSRCATCDGGFFRGQDVVVTGGGDAAVHEALELSRLAGTVTMVCRGPMKAKREYIDRLDARENVRFLWDSEIVEILGHQGVTGVRIRNVKDGVSSEVACAGVFPFVGVEPSGGFMPEALRAATGHVVATDPRIIPVGAVRRDYGGQAIEAMAEGIGAAEAAHELLGKGGWNGK